MDDAGITTLREIDKSAESSAALLGAFEQSRRNVALVSANPALPDVVVLATAAGFIQLVQTNQCSFRLFQLHVGDIPFLAPLRCIGLSPALFAARHEVHHLLLGHGFSNHLLSCNADTGECTTLSMMESRPSAVFSDGDYITAGDGCGTVELFRGTSHAAPSMLWKRRCGRSSVSQLCVHRNTVVVSFADFSTMVFALSTGEAMASLLHEASVAASLVPLPALECMAVLTRAGALTLFRACGGWEVASIVNLRTPAASASVDSAGIVAIGTTGGTVVILSASSDGSSAPQEVARFDVQQPIVCLQLYDANRALIVVTKAGDVWRWGIDEILGIQAAEGQQQPAEEADQEARVVPPPAPVPASSETSMNAAERVAPIQPSGAADDGMPQLDEAEVERVIEMFDNDFDAQKQQEAQRDTIYPRSTSPWGIAAAVAAAAHDVAAEADDDSTCQPPPSSVAALSLHRAGLDVSQPTQTATSKGPGNTSTPARGAEAGDAVAGYSVSIEGLREGRRMSPRAARYAVDQCQLRIVGAARAGPNDSQAAILATRNKLEEEQFDVQQYAMAHPAEAQGLRFRHPVAAVSFPQNEIVFSSVGLSNHNPNVIGEGRKSNQDDLVSATFEKFSRRRDEQFEQQRQRAGPDIWTHLMSDTLFSGGVSNVLFSEYHVRPAAPPLLMVGMPMPPTPLTY
jgi:hypothetical protein